MDKETHRNLMSRTMTRYQLGDICDMIVSPELSYNDREAIIRMIFAESGNTYGAGKVVKRLKEMIEERKEMAEYWKEFDRQKASNQ